MLTVEVEISLNVCVKYRRKSILKILKHDVYITVLYGVVQSRFSGFIYLWVLKTSMFPYFWNVSVSIYIILRIYVFTYRKYLVKEMTKRYYIPYSHPLYYYYVQFITRFFRFCFILLAHNWASIQISHWCVFFRPF